MSPTINGVLYQLKKKRQLTVKCLSITVGKFQGLFFFERFPVRKGISGSG